MDRPTTGVLRGVRSAVVTVVVVGLAATAHVAGGGHAPSGPVAGAVVVAVALAVHLLTRWRLSAPGVFALLAGGQWLLHRVFTALDSARTGPLDAGALNAVPVGRLAHAHALAAGASWTAAPSAAPHGTVSPAVGAVHAAGAAGVEVGPWVLTPMLVAHVVATVLAALVLAGAERALWRLWAWLSPLVVLLLAPLQPVAGRLPRAPRAALERRPVHEVLLGRSLLRRGPPVPLARA
ncbi:hypothetical protein [Kineococcus sp. SYSU DK005]|uniref:hypothetical protein n=1 Tax=Kineococcus sp. SYSU DK005 TaxID=3383126 RepID=UPI003D7CA860